MSLKITGREANLLLFALDKYLETDMRGHVTKTDDHFTLAQAQDLRDRLFGAHEHDEKDEIPVETYNKFYSLDWDPE